MEKSLSIIIPVYNLLKGSNLAYFEKLIDSLRENINISNLNVNEIIVINDNPIEELYEIVYNIFTEKYLEKKLVFIKNTSNKGQGFSRNYGANLASGTYLHFIDQDDYLQNNYYDFFCNHNVDYDIIISDLLFHKTEIQNNSYYSKISKFILLNSFEFKSLTPLLVSNIVVSPGQYIVNRKLFLQVGGFPDLKNKGSDDYGFMFNLILTEFKVNFKYVEESKFIYRIHPNQGSKNLILDLSIQEYFSFINKNRLSFIQKVIRLLKIKRSLNYVTKALYIMFFNRA